MGDNQIGQQGHNSKNEGGSIAADQLRALIERIERLEEEKKTLSEDIKEIYAEAKGNGFDTKVIRRVVSLRKQDMNERMEYEAVLNMYLSALGMQSHFDFDTEA